MLRICAWLLGLAFCISKVLEYTLKVRAGISPATNSFYSYYFFITIVHFLHVIAGMVFIGYCRFGARARVGTKGYVTGLENVGLFWHFDRVFIRVRPRHRRPALGLIEVTRLPSRPQLPHKSVCADCRGPLSLCSAKASPIEPSPDTHS